MRKKVFLTFGGPTQNYHNALHRICNEANNMNFFSHICGHTEQTLKEDISFWSKHQSFIENNPRGYGYWLWKPYLIKKHLEQLDDDDIIIYADAGCELNPNGLQRLNEYIEMLDNDTTNSGILKFQLVGHRIYEWTKKKVLEYFNSNENEKNNYMNLPGILFIKKNQNSVNFINDWYEISCNYELINDELSADENPLFKLPRHDQCIYTLLGNRYNYINIPDETFFHPNWEDGSKYPILAKRLR